MLGGRYRLVVPIARGGMADVWEGHDEVLSRPVAVKLLQAHLAEDGVFLERFRREAVTAARLAHPGVVSTFDTGVDAGTAFIVMELVRGSTLRQLLNEQGHLPPWLAVAIARQIADVLMYAHQAGLVHRDIKPANVLLTDDGWGGLRVKVTDFGIAKAGSGLGGDLTRTGMVLGTPKYLSPEQISGKEPDARADLYSLGIVLFEMVAGAPPFVGTTDMATALAHLNDRPPRLSTRIADVPPALDRLVADLLAKDPQRRVTSAQVLRRRLDELNIWPPFAGVDNGRRGRRHRDPHGQPTGTPAGPSGPIPPLAWPYRDGAARVPGGAAGAGGLPGEAPGPGPGAGGFPGQAAGASAGGFPGQATGAGGLPGEATTSAGPGGRVPALAALTAVLAARGGHAGDRPVSASPVGIREGTNPASTNASRQSSRPNPPPGPDPRTGTGPPGRAAPVSPSRRGRRRPGPGWLVLALVLVGAVVAGVLLSVNHDAASSGAGGGSPAAHQVASVSPFMLRGQPDDPQGLPYLFDSNPATAWHTDQYRTAAFGNLYPGLGLNIQLKASGAVHHLLVNSPTAGWAAQTYVSSTAIPSGQAVSAWGRATDTRTGISGSVTFSLGGRHGQWVLLWLTHLSAAGPPFQVTINEITVT
jgi:serine/threonine-protein kinase